MKNMSALIALTILSVNVFASPIPQNKLASYKEAVNLAMAQHPLNCVFTPSAYGWAGIAGSLSGAISKKTSGEINDSGAQPILTFSAEDESFKEVIMVTTSADYKSVVSVKVDVSQSVTQDINQGTIENPQIVSQTIWKTYVSVICQ